MTDTPFRLPSGGRIDRGSPVSFSFDGERYTGYAGDTLASALLAHGVRLVGRSFKYHRPRGVVTDGVEEPNALVQLGIGASGEPNARATQVEIHDGLAAASQNRWPSLGFDAGACERTAQRPDSGRVLLQDLHVARTVVDEVRVLHPAGGRARACPHRTGSGHLRQVLGPLRRPGGRSRPERVGRGSCRGPDRRAGAPGR